MAQRHQLTRFQLEQKRQNPRQKHYQHSCQHNQQITHSKKEKRTYHQTRSQTQHRKNHHHAYLIRWMTEITVNSKSRNAIQIKSVGNTRNRTLQNHRRVVLIRPKTVSIDASDTKRRSTEQWSYKIMRKVNGNVDNDSI